MTALETLIEPLRHSPRLVEAVDLLNRQIEEERERRGKFYAEMTPAQKVEFIEGRVVMHSPARNEHLDATVLISQLLGAHVMLTECGMIKIEKCLCVFPRNDYEPDIVFFGPEKAASLEPGTMKFPPPDLAVEILSTSTEKIDRGVKFEDYEAHGVQEYWIVDAEKRFVEQYVRNGDQFELRLKSDSGSIHSLEVAGFTSEIEAFFDPAKNLEMLRRLMNP